MDFAELKRELEKTVHENILNFWLTRTIDECNGGFIGQIDGNGNIITDSPKGAIQNGRILWTFSSAYRIFGRKEYLDAAQRAFDYITERFIDRRYGGVYWSLTAEGVPLDTKKQYYALAFVIYGLSEFYRATGNAKALEEAVKLFRDIEEHSYDPVNNGYEEASTREWGLLGDVRLSLKDANEKKTMNTHLHIIEAYTNLLRVWDDPVLRRQTANLLEIFLDKIMDDETGHLGLFFDDEWNLKSEGIFSYGHDIEASWLLLETAMVLNDEVLIRRTRKACRKIADASMEGYLEDGSMAYEIGHDGKLDSERHWWVQAEVLVGLVYLYKFHGDEGASEKIGKTWRYISENIIDHENGEWWWSIMPDGSVNRKDDKAGFWKCPYHNGRMCMEIISTIQT